MGLLNLFQKQTDRKNINLLPEEETESIFAKRDFIIALLIPVGVIIFLGLVFVLLFLLDTQQSLKHADLTKQIEQKQAEWSKFSDVASGITQIKTNIKTYQDATVKNKNLRSDFDIIRGDIPITITLSKIDLSQKGEASVEGTAPKAVDIYQYLQVLKNKTESYSLVVLKTVAYNSNDGTYRFAMTFSVKGGESPKNK